MLDYQVLKKPEFENDKGYQQARSSCKKGIKCKDRPLSHITSQGPELKSEQHQGLPQRRVGV